MRLLQSWLMYRWDADASGLSRKKQLPLLRFKMCIAHCQGKSDDVGPSRDNKMRLDDRGAVCAVSGACYRQTQSIVVTYKAILGITRQRLHISLWYPKSKNGSTLPHLKESAVKNES